MPKVDKELFNEARNFLPESWREHFDLLRPSERAHVLRVYSAIKNDAAIDEADRPKLLLLALAHDIGKGITRHGILFKVAKAVFPISNKAHCIAGARLLKKLKAPKWLIKMVLRHHSDCKNDRLLCIFQRFDDRL